MLPAMRILVVEDDQKIASFVVNGLRQSGFAVDHSSDGAPHGFSPASAPLRRLRQTLIRKISTATPISAAPLEAMWFIIPQPVPGGYV